MDPPRSGGPRSGEQCRIGPADGRAMRCDGRHSLTAIRSCPSRTVHNEILPSLTSLRHSARQGLGFRCRAELPFRAVPIIANANHLRWSIASNNLLFTPRAATQEVGNTACWHLGGHALWPLLPGNLMTTARNDKRKRKTRYQTRHQKTGTIPRPREDPSHAPAYVPGAPNLNHGVTFGDTWSRVTNLPGKIQFSTR